MSETPLEVSCRSVKEQLDADPQSLVLIDCREADEHALVAIPAARLLPMSEIQSRLAELEPHRGTPIVVHCHHGMRSAQVATWLRSQGFASAQSMAGGIDEWAVEIDPTLQRY